jgi:hypothetical protein
MKVKLTIGAIVAVVIGAAALAYGLYVIITSADLVLVWAIVATFMLPVAAIVGWVAGRYEVKALLRGVDMGADKVVNVAERIADIKDRRAPKAQQADIYTLPATVYHELPAGDEVIDL